MQLGKSGRTKNKDPPVSKESKPPKKKLKFSDIMENSESEEETKVDNSKKGTSPKARTRSKMNKAKKEK